MSATQEMPPATGTVVLAPPLLSRAEIFSRPLPYLDDEPLTRWALRLVLAAWRQRFLAADGLEHVAVEWEPFILAANHSTRLEAFLVPAFLMFQRGGRRVHFFADWNFMLYPGLGFLMRRAGVIVVTRKSARPRILNVLRPLFARPTAPFFQARQILGVGGAVGVFPEGTTNRDAVRMLAGHRGAARLSLETGAPVVPMGIRYPEHRGLHPIPDSEKMRLVIGRPIKPAAKFADGQAPLATVRDLHACIMAEIARLCGKRWEPGFKRNKHVV